MLNARAIVSRLLEAKSSEEDVDWSPDPTDPDETTSVDVPMSFPGLPGDAHEPLLRRVEKFRELAKAHGGGYTQRTGFYRHTPNGSGLGPRHFTYPHGARIHKLDSRTFAVFWPDGAVGIQLHGTVIIKRSAKGEYTVSSGGYATPVTMSRMQPYLPFGWSIYFKRSEGAFYWTNRSTGVGDIADGRVIKFTDGDRIQSDGTLVPQAPPAYRRVRKKRDEPTTQ